MIRSNDFLDEMFVFEIWFCAMSWLATYPQLVWFDPQTVTLSVCAPGEVSGWRIGRYRGTPLDSSLAPILIRWAHGRPGNSRGPGYMVASTA